MAIGKNRRAGKKGRKKVVDPMTRKEWYVVKAPAMFTQREFGRTIVNRTAGLKTSSDALKGRVFEVSLADLNDDEDQYFRKMKLVCEDVQGDRCLTNFHGMDFTRDKLCSLIKKWHTMIEAWVDVKTTDGYVLRLFCIAFTKKRRNQIRQIRAKMTEIMTSEASKCDLRELVNKFIPEYL